jgi:D-aminopeptidase
VPAGSTAVGSDTYLAPNGDLYKAGLLVATGVVSAKAEYQEGAGLTRVTYTTATGAFAAGVTNGGQVQFNSARTAVPAGSTAVGSDTYLTASGDLYKAGLLLATNVTSAAAEYQEDAGLTRITYTTNPSC